MTYTAFLTRDEEGEGFVATIPAFPGVAGQGYTEEDAIMDLTEALGAMVEYMEENGIEIPVEGRTRQIELA